MAAFASLIGPQVNIPQPNFSWLDSAFDSIGGAIQRGKENKSFNKLADLIGQPQSQASASLGPVGQPAQSQPQSYAAPVMPVDRSAPQGDTYRPFIDTVATKVTNPYGLSAIAATGRAESGWSGENANRTWSDPSQSGDPGTAGGIMSWRGPRLASLQNYAASKGEQGNGSPQTQAEFLLQENPQLIDQLNRAQSPEEAANLMANAWKFAGYDQQGGEAARRRALTQNYFANDFANMPTGAAAAIEAQAPGGMGSPLTDTSFDGRFGPTALPAEVAQGRDGLASALVETNRTGAVPRDPVSTANAQPVQVAGTGFNNVPGVTPIQRGGVDPSIIQFMLRDPNLRDVGLKLWAQNATGSTGEPWQFVQGPDGTLLRANQQTGAIEQVGNFAKKADDKAPQIVELFDEQTGQPYKARYNPQTMQYERVGGVKAPSGFNVTTNPDGTVSVTQGPANQNPKLTEQQSKDLVYYRRGAGALETLDPIAEELTSGWQKLADSAPMGNYVKTDEYQRAQQAGLEFLQAILRKDTGAAITPSEQEEYGKVYLPQPGDSAALLLQKRQARARALEAIRKGLGPADILAGERPRETGSKTNRTANGVEWSIED